MSLPSPVDQAEKLIALGVADLAGMGPDELREAAAHAPRGLLVTPAPASGLAPLLRRGERAGFVVEDMTDVDLFRPVVEVPAEAAYAVLDPDRGDAYANRSPEEVLPELLAAGRSPLTLVEGLHWALQVPEVLERNRCFMTIGSRLRRPDGRYDARTPALWISNGTGRDGRERRDAPKLGWCWWRNRHTWLGIASCAGRA
jgi:hypothetical protein